MPLHVVVTGAGGFVGGFIANFLAQRGFEVTAVTRRPPKSSTGKNLNWLQADLAKAHSLPDRFDALLHCAAEIPARCPDASVLFRDNVESARHVFHSARTAGARSVVFMSSMSVYGAVSSTLVTEDTPPADPDPYGRAKKAAEDILESTVRDGLFSGLSIRLPGTVGKGSHHNFLSDTLTRILADLPVTAKNPDAAFNNIVYVGDLAAFMEQWIKAPLPGYAVTNLAAEDAVSIREVISLLFSCAGKPPGFTFDAGGKSPFLISLDRARELGYRPSTVQASIKAFVHDNVAPE